MEPHMTDPKALDPGYGYTAIAIAMLGRLEPGWVVVAAVFFGALEAGADRMEVPTVVARMVEGLLLLLFLAADRMRKRA